MDGVDFDADLGADGILVRDQFLTFTQAESLRQCVQMRQARGDFKPARIGADHSLQRRAEVRGDSICWLAEPLFPAERALLDSLEQVRLSLNRNDFLGLFDLELHYAWYPSGAGYDRHVDQPQGRMHRQVSLVIYLNEGWSKAAGGELRLFDADDNYCDISPIAGRMICFVTARREHAVLTAHAPRLSITGWFRTRE